MRNFIDSLNNSHMTSQVLSQCVLSTSQKLPWQFLHLWELPYERYLETCYGITTVWGRWHHPSHKKKQKQITKPLQATCTAVFTVHHVRKKLTLLNINPGSSSDFCSSCFLSCKIHKKQQWEASELWREQQELVNFVLHSFQFWISRMSFYMPCNKQRNESSWKGNAKVHQIRTKQRNALNMHTLTQKQALKFSPRFYLPCVHVHFFFH